MSKKVLGCIAYVTTLVLLFASAIIPTVHLEEMHQCSFLPSTVLAIETVVLATSFIYFSIHIVLIIYHCNLRSQLQTMNIEEVSMHW